MYAFIILADILSTPVAFLIFRFEITFSTVSHEAGVNEKISVRKFRIAIL